MTTFGNCLPPATRRSATNASRCALVSWRKTRGHSRRSRVIRQTTWLDDLAGRFQRSAIPTKEWTHAAHLVVGLWHVHRYGATDALARLRSGIRRLNESHGGVNSTTNGYRETITAAYVQLLAQFLNRRQTDMPLDMQAIDLLAGPLAARDVLFTFYSHDRLMSTTARLEWLEPDRAPVHLSDVMNRRALAL